MVVVDVGVSGVGVVTGAGDVEEGVVEDGAIGDEEVFAPQPAPRRATAAPRTRVERKRREDFIKEMRVRTLSYSREAASRMCYTCLHLSMKPEGKEKWFFLALLGLTGVLVALIFQPFLSVLVVGASFAVILYPAFRWFCAKRVPSGLSALLVTALFVGAVGVPIIGIGAIIFHQTQNVYQELSSGQGLGSLLDVIDQSVQRILPAGYTIDLREQASRGAALIATNVGNVFASTMSILLAVVLVFISIFYFLKDGPRWVQELIRISPLTDRNDEKILKKLTQSVQGIIQGYLFIALIQGVLMGFGLAIFGVPNPALWGLVAMGMSLLPTIGTAVVSVPAILFLLLTGHIWQAIGLGLWAGLLVGTVDNFLSPMIVGNKVQIPPLFILFSVLGGIALLGPVGLLVGPLAVSLLHTLFAIYKTGISTTKA